MFIFIPISNRKLTTEEKRLAKRNTTVLGWVMILLGILFIAGGFITNDAELFMGSIASIFGIIILAYLPKSFK